MALEAVVFQQDQMSYGFKDFYSLVGNYGFGLEEDQAAYKSCDINQSNNEGFGSTNGNWDTITGTDKSTSSPEYGFVSVNDGVAVIPVADTTPCRRKRRRCSRRGKKNKEEIENQRMTHIAVERNRRKQMNDYLAVLRTMMPPSYVQRGDQASIIGGAINFVKELEQHLQSLEVHKRVQLQQQYDIVLPSASNSDLFSDFFSFPQYSTRSEDIPSLSSPAEKRSSAVADVEVTMVENHANLKIMSKRHPKQLVNLISGIQSLGLLVLHLNVTTVDHVVLYSLSLKVEDHCQMSSANEIASAVHEMVARNNIQHQAQIDRLL